MKKKYKISLILSILLIAGLIINGLNEDTIAIIPLKGEIGYDEGMLNPQMVQEAFEEAEDDSNVKAIVLEVNSPGGTPVASSEIMETIKDSKKPVVAWISDTGASGAYLAASASDKIIASKSSWVGSIGVIMNLQDLSNYYKKNGIDIYSIKSGQYKDMGANYRSLTRKEREILQGMVNEEYENFIDIVSENRGLDKTYVRSISEGQVFTGLHAKELQLIDDVGTKKQALNLAAQLANIKRNPNIRVIETSTSLLNTLFF